MKVIRKTPEKIDKAHVFCPGCGHGIVYRLVHEVIEELGYENNHITVLGVGCSCNINGLSKGDKFQCAHGRASAVATGMKRMKKDVLIVTYRAMATQV